MNKILEFKQMETIVSYDCLYHSSLFPIPVSQSDVHIWSVPPRSPFSPHDLHSPCLDGHLNIMICIM